MTPRERIADWITGGALTRAREELSSDVWISEIAQQCLATRNAALRAILTARNITEARKIAKQALGEE